MRTARVSYKVLTGEGKGRMMGYSDVAQNCSGLGTEKLGKWLGQEKRSKEAAQFEGEAIDLSQNIYIKSGLSASWS